MPFTLSFFYYISYAGLSTIGLLVSSPTPSAQVRFVLHLHLPGPLPSRTSLSDHGNTQVIAPYLITLRVANQRALASNTISGTFGSIHFGTKRTTYSDGSLVDGSPVDSMEVKGEAPDEPGDGVVGVIEEAPL